MATVSPTDIPAPPGEHDAAARSRFTEDASWLTVIGVVTALEAAWWTVTWQIGLAPLPYLLAYVALTFAGLGAAMILRLALQPRSASPNWTTVLPATFLIALGASFFLPLKCAIPQLVPFWLDHALAGAERTIFTTDPWRLLDHVLGWAAVPIDRIYAFWLPTQALVLFTIILQPPSRAKSRVLIAYVTAWFLLGVVAALLFSSAGPLFHDRIFGGAAFAALPDTLRNRGAWMALAESDKMWASLATGDPGLVSGISALPSIHVAISVWIVLAARSMAPRLAPWAIGYAALIWIGSVQLGWHYVTDGLAGGLGMLAVWQLSRSVRFIVAAGLTGLDAIETSRSRRGHTPDT